MKAYYAEDSDPVINNNFRVFSI